MTLESRQRHLKALDLDLMRENLKVEQWRGGLQVAFWMNHFSHTVERLHMGALSFVLFRPHLCNVVRAFPLYFCIRPHLEKEL